MACTFIDCRCATDGELWRQCACDCATSGRSTSSSGNGGVVGLREARDGLEALPHRLEHREALGVVTVHDAVHERHQRGREAAHHLAEPCDSTTRDASEGKGRQRRPRRRLDARVEGVAEAVGGGYCRLQMPLRLALAVRGTVAGHRLGALEGGGGGRSLSATDGGGGGGAHMPEATGHCSRHVRNRRSCTYPPFPPQKNEGAMLAKPARYPNPAVPESRKTPWQRWQHGERWGKICVGGGGGNGGRDGGEMGFIIRSR